ncbi:MAG: ACT domain-containing protein [Chloroflexi bacterium]|nr:ACT domain-containing protein [Chloroflexota bacterium]
MPWPYAVCRLAPDAPVPQRPAAATLWSLTHTASETSLVVDQSCLNADWVCARDTHVARDWRCLRVRGPLEFTLIGVLSGLLDPLARAGISVFALSTYDTDYLLVRQADLPAACAALKAAGYTIAPPI